MPQGRIKKFIDDRGFGFIQPDEGEGEVFFHQSDVIKDGHKIAEGAPVKYEHVVRKEKGPAAGKVTIQGPPPKQSRSSGRSSSGSGLPDQCIFESLCRENGQPRVELFFEVPESVARAFGRNDLKRSQFRQIYQAFKAFAVPLQEERLSFEDAKTRFGTFYTERIVRQVNRGHVPEEVKEFIDAHRDQVLSSKHEMLALFRYLTNVLCYFKGD